VQASGEMRPMIEIIRHAGNCFRMDLRYALKTWSRCRL